MKYLVSVVVGAAVVTVAITTAIANFRHASPLQPPYIYGYGFAVLLLLAAGIIAIVISRQEQTMPQIIGTRYGHAAVGTHSHGYQVDESGLVVANHGEPAYEIGVYSPLVPLGSSFRLHFTSRLAHLRKEDGESQISAWGESEKQGGFLGSGLCDFMRQHDIGYVKVPVLYKDIKNRCIKPFVQSNAMCNTVAMVSL